MLALYFFTAPIQNLLYGVACSDDRAITVPQWRVIYDSHA